MIKGATYGTRGTTLERTGKRMSWGDMSTPPATTPAYREGMDRIFGDTDKARKQKQDTLAADARITKASMLVRVYEDKAPQWAIELVAEGA